MDQTPRRPRVMLIAGYFDWFSGYQETSLARALAPHCDLTVLAGNRVSPIFSDDHLAKLGLPRQYSPGRTEENGATMIRVPVKEIRSMVWSLEGARFARRSEFDLVIQIMPGQVLPLAGMLARSSKRVALYGDNSAMYASLTPVKARIKFAAFAASKGLLYTLNNLQADQPYGYTHDTLQRLRHFGAGKPFELLPLTVDADTFYYSSTLRDETRESLGISESTRVIIAPGKPQPQKRIDALLSALNAAPSDSHLLIVGSDDSKTSDDLRRQVSVLEMDQQVTFIPFVDAPNLNRYFNAADLGVWPLMPAITIQQAMLTGLPVAIPRNDYTQHLFREGANVEQIPGARDVREALVDVLHRPTNSSAAARTAARAANSWFSSTAVAHELLNVLA